MKLYDWIAVIVVGLCTGMCLLVLMDYINSSYNKCTLETNTIYEYK